MNKERYLAELKSSLGRMPEAEKKDVLSDYQEHFRMGLADGKSEEEISQSLGSPRLIGKSFRIDSLLEEPSDGAGVSAVSVIRAVFATISLGFFNLLIVLGPFLAVVGLLIGLWATAVSLPLTGIAVVLAPAAALFFPGFYSLASMSPAFLVFAGIGVTGLGVLAVIGMWKLTQLFADGVAAYVRFNARVVRRRR